MPQVTFVVDGADRLVDATGYANLMQVAVENDIPTIEGECGGDMTCGTCHVYLERLPDGYHAPRGADEQDMLDAVAAPTDASRLACQLPVDEHVGGLRLRIP